MPRRLLAFALLVLLTACGGGGGGGDDGGGGGVGIRPTGSLSGRITFSTGIVPIRLEAEPNDVLGEAQVVGDLPLGGRLTILGRLGGADDPLDAFRIRVPQRARITATLTAENPAANDFDLALYDPLALQFVESWSTTSAVEEARYHAKGILDLVLSPVTGEAPYELVVRADPILPPIAEPEPNDGPGEAQYLGEILVGDQVTI